MHAPSVSLCFLFSATFYIDPTHIINDKSSVSMLMFFAMTLSAHKPKVFKVQGHTRVVYVLGCQVYFVMDDLA